MQKMRGGGKYELSGAAARTGNLIKNRSKYRSKIENRLVVIENGNLGRDEQKGRL